MDSLCMCSDTAFHSSKSHNGTTWWLPTMKINKYSIITISIVVPLIITVLIAMYSYGAIGDWTKKYKF